MNQFFDMERLINLPLFRGLTVHELNAAINKVVFQRKVFPKDAMIALQGEPCDRLIILIYGSVKGEMTDPAGKSLKIEDMVAPMALASAFLFGNNAFFPVNVVANEEVELMQIPKQELLRLFQLDQRILQNYLGMISSRAQFLSEKLRFHSFKSLKAKVAFYLLNEAGKGHQFKMKHSQNDLAELFGVARPSVGRVFMQLQEEGLIDARYREITIVEKEKLSRIFRE